jgi:hypothetical protein
MNLEVLMKLVYLCALCLLASAAIAQTTSTPTFLTAVSTGMVGLAGSQTAQLNVVNLSSTPPTSSAAATSPCEVQLEFWDPQNKLVKSLQITNLSPGTAGSLQIKLPDVATSATRTDVRGVVRTTPATFTTTSPQPGQPVMPIAFPARCSVATTLEVFDSATGVTQALTSDTKSIQPVSIVPLMGVR